MRRYNEAERLFLRETIPGRSYEQTAGLFNAWNNALLLEKGESRRPPITVAQVKSFCGNNAIHTNYKGNRAGGNKGSFKKGQVSHNKGKHCRYSPATEFKKGNIPANHRPVGSTRITVDGYTEIKVAEPRKWRMLHVVVWEREHGPVPNGHVIIFGDGNRQNATLDNLILVTRAELAMLNKFHLIGESAELTQTGVIIANLRMKMRQRQKETQKRKGAKAK